MRSLLIALALTAALSGSVQSNPRPAVSIDGQQAVTVKTI